MMMGLLDKAPGKQLVTPEQNNSASSKPIKRIKPHGKEKHLEAAALCRKGWSLREISRTLNITRDCLGKWFRGDNVKFAKNANWQKSDVIRYRCKAGEMKIAGACGFDDDIMNKVCYLAAVEHLPNCEIAKRVGISHHNVSRWLNCEIKAFCKVTGWSETDRLERLVKRV